MPDILQGQQVICPNCGQQLGVPDYDPVQAHVDMPPADYYDGRQLITTLAMVRGLLVIATGVCLFMSIIGKWSLSYTGTGLLLILGLSCVIGHLRYLHGIQSALYNKQSNQ